jgi:hypothetical protein
MLAQYFSEMSEQTSTVGCENTENDNQLEK